jgi:hypothetical protein
MLRFVPSLPLAAIAAMASVGCEGLLDLDVQYSLEGGAPGVESGAGESGVDGDATADGTVGKPDGSSDVPDAGAEASADGPGAAADALSEASPGDAPHEAIAILQVLAQESTNDSPTQMLTFPQPVQAHSAIILGVECGLAAVTPQIVDSANDTFKLATSLPVDGFGVSTFIYYALDVPAGNDVITVSLPGTNSAMGFEVFAHEVSNVAALDAVNGRNGDGSSSSETDMESGFVTTAVANELIFGFGVGGTVTEGAGFTALSYFVGDLSESRILAAPGMVEATATNANASVWSLMVATFEPR